jgi:hypothetical protein
MGSARSWFQPGIWHPDGHGALELRQRIPFGVCAVSISIAAIFRRNYGVSQFVSGQRRVRDCSIRVSVWDTPGYSYLRQGIELYELNSANELSAEEDKFNAIIAKNSVAVPERSFSRWGCFDNGYEIKTNHLARPMHEGWRV